MTQRQEFVVYLSSTLADLEAERETALKTIAEAGRVQTSYRAGEEGVIENCVNDVRRCALYVGIVGQRYGYVPADAAANPNGLSITELEYESCRAPGQRAIPRLMFVKPTDSGIKSEHIDALCHPETAGRMAAFLDRAGKEQTAYRFKNLEDLRSELRIRVMEQADRFHRENADRQLTFHADRPWARQLAPVIVACAPGSDHAQRDAILKHGGSRFRAADLRPADDDYLATLDTLLQQAQVACLLLTPASLARLADDEYAERVTLGLAAMRTRLGQSVLLCEGVAGTDLPAAWKPDCVIELPANQLVEATPLALDSVYERMAIEVPALSVEPALALPYVVLAPTLAEVSGLCSEASAFDGFDNPTLRQLWRDMFKRVAPLARAIDADWPQGTYGARRHGWRCFGPASACADDMVRQALRRINEAPAGSRERRFLKNARLVGHRYDLDDFLVDRYGSRHALEAIRDQGCLFVVDEVGLLHPALRAAADQLLVGAKTAIVAVCPCDPAHTATRMLLNEPSYLRVGSIVSRFRNEQDPRCEVALNSIDRVERWLRVTIPELVASADEPESLPRLVAQATALLG
jgi:hypothetical protein